MRSLRGSDTLQRWISETERRLSRVERRGQTTGVAVPETLLAVATEEDIPESTEPDTTTVYIVSTGERMNFDSATRRWAPRP